MKLLKLLSICLLAAGISACNEIETPDGKIPTEYLEMAQAYAGTYSGKFGKQEGSFKIEFEGQKPVLSFVGPKRDLIGERCQSLIGDMQLLDVDKKKGKYRVDYAVFDFSPGYCKSIEGRSLTVNFKYKKGQLTGMNVMLLDQVVHTNCDYPDYGGDVNSYLDMFDGGGVMIASASSSSCDSYIYKRGKFKKAK